MIRLNKYLAESGIASRRKCDDLILAGKVQVNGVVERRLGLRVRLGDDEIKYEDRLVAPKRKFEYILLNKPRGFVTTTSDERSRKTVLDLIDSTDRLFPVGRLDIDTTGLLILTNDGDLTHKLTHPKFNIDKTYAVKLDRELSVEHKALLESGIDLEEGKTSSCQIRFTQSGRSKVLRMTIHQGWNRQIRRMFAKLDYNVVELRRTQIAGIVLDGLRIGKWRYLAVREVESLRAL